MTFLAYCSKKFTHKNAKLNQPSLFVTSYLQISPLAKIYLCSKDFLLSQMLVKVIWAIFRAGFIFVIWNYYQNIVPLIVFAITKNLKIGLVCKSSRLSCMAFPSACQKKHRVYSSFRAKLDKHLITLPKHLLKRAYILSVFNTHIRNIHISTTLKYLHQKPTL